MKLSNTLTGLILIAGLSACAPTPVKFEPVLEVNWQQQQVLQKQLQSWTIRGRISVQTEDDGGQADYIWKQQNLAHYNIHLVAPMGAGSIFINSRANGVSLKTLSGDTLFDTDVDKLMLKLNGWPLPVSGLQYWARGLPTPASDYNVIEWKDSGLPGVMYQDGWRIEFKKYRRIETYYLPGKIFISRLKGNEIDVRLVIRQWALDAGLNRAQ